MIQKISNSLMKILKFKPLQKSFEAYGDNIESTQQKDREQQNNRFSVF